MFGIVRQLVLIGLLLVIVDIPWLWASSSLSAPMFKKIQCGMPMEPRWYAAVPVYLALAYLLQIARSTVEAGLIGLCTYAVYDFTNLTTLTNYSLEVAIADSMWGGLLFMIVRELSLRLGLL
jgi:uncharacterized membrane protein